METKNIILGLIMFMVLVIFGLAFYTKAHPEKSYDIKIDYCDGFTSTLTTVKSDHMPNDSDIRMIGTYGFYLTYLDVCHITVVGGF